LEGLESFFTSGQQLNLFLLSCLFGIPVGIVYDIFRAFRIVFRHCKAAVIIEDIIFFMLYGIFIMCFTITFARSEFRFYYCLGNILGFILYYVTIGQLVSGFFKKTAEVIKKRLNIPLKKFVLMCGKFINKFVGSFQNIKSRKKNRKIH